MSRGGYHTKWENVYLHFEKFWNGKCRFDEINVDLCNKFFDERSGKPITRST